MEDTITATAHTHIYENEEIVRRINLDEIPLTALRLKTIKVLSTKLNSLKVLPSEEGFARDWRGLQHYTEINRNHNHVFSSTELKDPTATVLTIWSGEEENSGNLGKLQQILGWIDRWDVVDDTNSLFLEDAELFLTNKKNPKFTVNLTNSENKCLLDSDSNILTKDDAIRAQNGLPPQVYDAFLLFVDEDMNYALEIIDKMEACGFKLCVKDRDLLGGISFEHEAVLRLISERCNRLIVIISNAFLQSNANKFFVNFGQAIGIEQGRRKIVPCIFEASTVLPYSFSFYFILRYHRKGSIFDFWGKLQESIQCTHREITENKQIILNNPMIMIESADPTIVATENRTPRLLAISNDRDKSRIQEINSTVVNYSRQRSEGSVKMKLNMLAPATSTLRTTSLLDLTKSNSTSLENLSELSKSNLNLSKSKKTKWYKKIFLNASKEMEIIEKKEKKKKKYFKGIKVAEN